MSQFGYRLTLFAEPSRFPGLLVISVLSRNNFGERQLSWNVDESPNYVVYHGKWPDFQTGVYFTLIHPRNFWATLSTFAFAACGRSPDAEPQVNCCLRQSKIELELSGSNCTFNGP